MSSRHLSYLEKLPSGKQTWSLSHLNETFRATVNAEREQTSDEARAVQLGQILANRPFVNYHLAAEVLRIGQRNLRKLILQEKLTKIGTKFGSMITSQSIFELLESGKCRNVNKAELERNQNGTST